MKPLLLSLLLPACPLVAAEGFSIIRTDDTLTVKLDGEVFTEYRTDSRVPYLHPLKSGSGAVLSRRWPMDDSAKDEERDHPHHRSLWLSHGNVNGHDFWAWQFGKDPQMRHVAFQGLKDDSFGVTLAWTAGGKTLVNETREYSFKKLDDRTTRIDVTSVLMAGEDDAVFGDTKEGFFALRVDRTLRQKGPHAKGTILDSEGRKDGDCWGKRSKWVAFAGPDEKDKPAVVAIFDHPSNLRFPTWWHARDYGLLAANPFGIHDFENKKNEKPGEYVLEKGKPVTFRYGVILHHGNLESAKLPELWNDFSANP